MKEHWIGLQDDSGQNDFKWTDQTLLSFTNFAPGRPDSVSKGSYGECGLSIDGKWYDERCNSLKKRPYVCKVPFFNNAGSGNYVFFKYPLNWLSAQARCKSIGANLVTIETAAENKYILEQLKLR